MQRAPGGGSVDLRYPNLEALGALGDTAVLLAGLFETSPVPIQIFDAQGYSRLVNPAFVAIFGRGPPPEYCLLKDEILERQGMLPGVRQAFAGETMVMPPISYEVTELHGFDHTGVRPGRLGLQGTLMPLFGRDGQVQHVVLWIRDVTAEMELGLQKERQRLTFATARVVALDTNLTRGTLQLSDAAKETLGLAPEVPLGTLEELLALVDPADRAGLEAFERNRSASGPLDLPFRLVRPGDAGVLWLERRGQVVRDEVTHDTWRRGIVTDISERVAREAALRASEAALQRTEAQLRQAQKLEALGRLAGGIAHDFNNLLSVVISYGDMLLAGDELSARGRKAVTAIRTAGEQATHLTRQLLAVSRQQVLELRVVDLREVVSSTAEILGRVLGENVELIVRSGAEPACIRADAGQLEQVVMNLAINARDAMPSGGTLVIETQRAVLDEHHVREHLGVEAGPHVRLTVSDTGVGMDKQTQSHIFEPFFTTKEPGKGTGLGLATVFGIVQQSGGHIAVHSELGAGSTFALHFPRVDAPAEVPSTAPAPTTLRGEETVLLVEDQEEVRLVARAIMVRYGYRVLDASTPSAALEICERHGGAIDVLLTDIVMPRMNGRELAERATRIRPQMRVLLMSGYTQDALVQHGAGGFAYLQKPLVPEVLARRLREVLEAPDPASPGS